MKGSLILCAFFPTQQATTGEIWHLLAMLLLLIAANKHFVGSITPEQTGCFNYS